MKREISPSWPPLKHTHTHDVRDTGREDHVPARAMTDIEERGMIDFKFLTGFGSQAPNTPGRSLHPQTRMRTRTIFTENTGMDGSSIAKEPSRVKMYGECTEFTTLIH